jgi:pimeloyl-ACP methyl ester carboxylesterase
LLRGVKVSHCQLIMFAWIWRNKGRVLGGICAGVLVAYLVTYVVVETGRSPTASHMTTTDGRTLAYMQVHAEVRSDAIPVVLVHGAPADAGCWRRVWERMRPGFPGAVYAIDRLGYGNSSPDEELSLDAHARAVHDFLATLPSPPALVGHSYGAPVVLRVAASWPKAVRGVILVAGACDPYMNDTQNLRRALDAVSPVVPTSWAHANAELLALTDENRAMEPDLGSVTCPVVMIHGTWDPVCPFQSTADYLRRALTHAAFFRVRAIPHAGHNVHLHHADVIVQEIDALEDPE